MVKDSVDEWARVEPPRPDPRRDHLDVVKYRHLQLPVSVVVFEEDKGDWYVRGSIRGTHERTIADDPYGSKSVAMRAAYDWMRRNPHPARMATEDRDLREGDARRMAEDGLYGDVGLFGWERSGGRSW